MIHAQRALTTVTEAEHSLLWHLIRYPDVKSPFIVSFHELGKGSSRVAPMSMSGVAHVRRGLSSLWRMCILQLKRECGLIGD